MKIKREQWTRALTRAEVLALVRRLPPRQSASTVTLRRPGSP